MARRALKAEWPGLLVLAGAVAFGALLLAPETSIGRVPLNDSVFHLAATERLIESFDRGEPFLDPWVSEWALGYPLWRSYQPLPHLFAAGVLRAAEPLADHATSFAVLQYALLALLPASVYAGARLLGLDPCAAGLASMLTLAPSGTAALDRYGLGYGATTWRGSGLYTQLVALHLLPLLIGIVARNLDTGRCRGRASMLLAGTALSHIVFGYVAFASAALLAIVGPARRRARRLIRLATIVVPALFLMAWFVVPLFLVRAEINHSRWEDPFKWDSFGAPVILRALASGQLLDGRRFPALSLLLLGATVVAARYLAEPLPRRLLALTTLWLVLFFGRQTWGSLLLLCGIPAHLHVHRFQAAFELCAVMLSAWGVDRAVRALGRRSRPLALTATGAVVALLVVIAGERSQYLRENARWGVENLAAFAAEKADLDAALADLRGILAERPGRVWAGRAAGWGGGFKVGAVPVYAFLTQAHFDQTSFLYHSMSATSDVMVLRADDDLGHDVAFAVRGILAPVGQPIFYRRKRAQHGRFAVYEGSPEGYFGLVDIAARYEGPPSSFYQPSSAWLQSPLLPAGIVVALGSGGDPLADGRALPGMGNSKPLPPVDPAFASPRGRVTWEGREGEVHRARVSVNRPCHVLIRVTWHPDLKATVDGAPTPIERVTPGFGAIPVSSGEHEILVHYEPPRWKPALLALGVALFAASAPALRSRRLSGAAPC